MQDKVKPHKPSNKRTMYQRGVYYSNIKIYKKLLDGTAELVSNKNFFFLTIEKYLSDKDFHSLEEHLNT
jgi:hypothetical protein